MVGIVLAISGSFVPVPLATIRVLCSFAVDRNVPAGRNVVRARKMNGSRLIWPCIFVSVHSCRVVLTENAFSATDTL